jgi:hypothetical protein
LNIHRLVEGMAAWVDPEQVKRSRAFVTKVAKEKKASWLNGEVQLHCIRCEAEVYREDCVCPCCHAPLKKECPRCHYWVDMDTTFCVSCRHAFPLPPPPRATVRLWHECSERD